MNRTCTVPGCEKPARSNAAEWCKMHYHRWYRHGSTDKVAHQSGVTASNGRRYKMRWAKGHPLADKWDRVYTHRYVLYAEIGPGPHGCHWCGVPVHWHLPKGNPNQLHVDHLNDYGDDNRIENLVPSCPRCNSARGSQRRRAALLDAGWWSNHDTIAELHNGGRQQPVDPAA